MSSPETGFSPVRHDWHSEPYVAEWIARDATRDAERRRRLGQMLEAAPYPQDAAIAVLDVGGGYGVLTEEVLRIFPYARVTLQDYSQPMLIEARRRLAQHAGRVAYSEGDLRDPGWTRAVGGPFDLAVSAIAVHNLRDPALIALCYRAVASVLKPGAMFLDYDLFGHIGGVAAQSATLKEAGFSEVGCLWQQPPLAILAATRSDLNSTFAVIAVTRGQRVPRAESRPCGGANPLATASSGLLESN